MGLILVQALLGAATIWSNKAADIATAHVLVGAVSLAFGLILSIILSAEIAMAGTVRPFRPNKAPSLPVHLERLLPPGASNYLDANNLLPLSQIASVQDRPFPSGRMQAQSVLLIGCACSVLGWLTWPWRRILLTSVIGACSLLTYVFVYTPLKRVTWLNTVVGAIPGGLPPLMGWTAARGRLDADGWALFGILALWQLPHFMAIAWMYRDEYARAGFKMLPVIDPEGHRTGSQAVSHTLALVPVSLCPSM